MRILFVEDDLSLQKGVALKLEREGHTVYSAQTAFSARSVPASTYDMVILDVNLPDASGLNVCRQLRFANKNLHILLLTANDTETDIVMGYELGADDYMTKPFSLAVLLSKVNAAERRINSVPPSWDGWGVEQGYITVRGKKTELTRNEARLLSLLWDHQGQVLSKEQLLEALWDIDGRFIHENTLAVNIRRLREKIEADPSRPKLIENVRGIGYRLNREGLC